MSMTGSQIVIERWHMTSDDDRQTRLAEIASMKIGPRLWWIVYHYKNCALMYRVEQ